MAKSAAGKWVSRVGASGGGKAYKKSRPSNYYGALAVIVVLGLVATVYSRYEYQHPASPVSATPPAVGTTWYAGLSVEACGTTVKPLTTDPTYKGGFSVLKNNVIKISPVSAADSGNNATLAQFANEYPGLIASSNELAIPTSTGTANPKTTFHNGDACPANSKYAGKSAQISYAYWTSFGQKKPTITTNPSSIKFVQYMRVTMAFEPAGVTPLSPSQTTVDAMVQAGSSTTSTTVPSVSSTTTPTVTPTTVPTSSSTSAPTTSTTAPKG